LHKDDEIHVKQKKPKPSKLETGIGLFILLVITGIAVGVFSQQFQLNPAVISLQDTSSSEHETAISGYHTDIEDLVPVPEGMVSMSEPELFSPDTLYEKINGKAELYLSAGFNCLLCRRIKLNTLSELWMEAFVYEMKSPSGAFAVFSAQRREGGTPTEISPFSYQTENAVFLVHGSNYLEIISSEPSEEMKHRLFEFAKRFIQQAPAKDVSIPELSMFPKECSDLNRISVIPSSAFGFNKLDNIFTSLCSPNGKEVTVFISNRQTPLHAERLSSEYRDFLKSFGGVELPGLSQLKNSRFIEIFDAYELFFASGSYFCGVHEAADRKTAEQAAIVLFNRISEASK
jgi:hypothetical protein